MSGLTRFEHLCSSKLESVVTLLHCNLYPKVMEIAQQLSKLMDCYQLHNHHIGNASSLFNHVIPLIDRFHNLYFAAEFSLQCQ